jgi:hypothetical protein
METKNSRVLDQVFSDKEAFIVAVARHHAILNVCQDHLLNEAHDIAQAWNMCIEAHCDGMSESAAEKCCEGERRHFMADSRRQVTAVMKAGLPWTIRSAESFWPPPPKAPKKK